MKPKQGALLIGLILAAVATVLLLVLPPSANLTVAYVFCLLGIAMLLAGALSIKLDDVPASYALLWQSGGFLPCSLIVSAAVLILQGAGAFALPTIWHIVIQLGLLAVFAIRLIAVLSGKTYIRDVGRGANARTARLASLVSEVDAVQVKAGRLSGERRAEAIQALKRVSEALRYADPMGTGAAAEHDARIEAAVGELAGLCSPEGAERLVEACGSLCAAIKERNEAVKRSK